MKFDDKKIFPKLIILFILSFSLFYIIQLLFAGRRLNDFFWHYKVGEWIIKNKEIPTNGIFSWYAQEHNLYWYSHEWLSAVLIYLISFKSPIIAMVTTSIIGFIVVCFMVFTTKKYLTNNWSFYLLYTTIAVVILMIFFYPRPHVFSFLLLFWLMAAIYKYKEDTSSKLIYTLPIISVLWANIHGGSSNLVYILPIFVIITSCFNFEFGKLEFTKLPKKANIKLGIITIIDILCLMINPHGYKLLLYPLDNMNDDLMQYAISEWHSPNLKTTSSLIICIPVLITLLSLCISKKKINAMDLLVFLFFTYMYARSERFITLFIISSLFYVYKYAFDLSIDKFYEYSFKFKVGVYSFLIFFILGCAYLGIQGIAINKAPKAMDDYITQEVRDVIDQYPHERIYNHYNIGANLIYYGYDVYIDGRADMYSGHNFQDSCDMISYSIDKNGEPKAKKIIEENNFDMFICSKTDKTIAYLKQYPKQYKEVYNDDNVVIYITNQGGIE